MTNIDIRPLSDELTFGARVKGVDWAALDEEDLRQELRDLFTARGVIVFEDMESSDDLQLALSEVFGPLQDHAIKNMNRVEGGGSPGLVRLGADAGKANVFEIGGEVIAGVIPWHFDACYTEKLNRAGVLRMVRMPPDRGLTGFADGIQMYDALSPEWQARAAAVSVIYDQANMHDRQRYAMRPDWRILQMMESTQRAIAEAASLPRAVHPAVWQRETGEKVLHLAGWQADGVAGWENAEGDALLEDLLAEMMRVMRPYWHAWTPSDMVIWDNWRFVHASGGYDPQYDRVPHRTTIAGDYGLGRVMARREAA